MRRTVLRLALLAITLAIAVAGLEIVLRVVKPTVAYQYAPQRIILTHFTTSDYLPFTLKRNFTGRFRMLEFDTTVTTNSLGLRDREVDFSKPRILCLGDSFTFGFGVENDETFCARLEAAFGGRYDVVNAGFADCRAPDTYALFLQRRFEEVRPSLIVVSVFQNDAEEMTEHLWQPDGNGMPQRILKPDTIVTSDGGLQRDNRMARLWPPLRMLIKESYLVAIIRDRWLRDVDQPPAATPATPVPAPAAPAESAPHGEVETAQDRRFRLALSFLREAARGTPVLMHLIPWNRQTADSHADTVVKQFASSAGWPIVQEYGVFEPADYFAQDGHWLPSGHAKAARYLHDAITRLGF